MPHVTQKPFLQKYIGVLIMMTLAQADIYPSIRPYWRWQAALDEVNSPSKRKTTPEPEIAELMAYLRGDPGPRRSVIDAARKIFEEDGLLRAEQEGRILAGQTDEEIASRCDLPVEVVTTYEEMFFFVRRYHRATDWLLSRTNERTRWYGYLNHQLRQLWAWFAIGGGPIILDYMIGAYRAVAGSITTPRIDLYFSKKSPLDLNVQGSIALFTIPVDWDPMWHVELGVRWDEIAAIQDPDLRQEKLDDLHREFISLARRGLTGKLVKEPNVAAKQGRQTPKRGEKVSKNRPPRRRYPGL